MSDRAGYSSGSGGSVERTERIEALEERVEELKGDLKAICGLVDFLAEKVAKLERELVVGSKPTIAPDRGDFDPGATRRETSKL